MIFAGIPRRRRDLFSVWPLIGIAILAILAGCGRPLSESPPLARTALSEKAASAAGVLRVSFIDVGQGDSELVQTPRGKAILIDAGEVDREDDVVRYLKSQRIRQLDYVIATHPHSDHIGGMKTVLKSFPVRQFLDSGFPYGSRTQEKMLLTIRARAIPFHIAQQGDRLSVEPGVRLEILSPKKPYLKNTDSDPNNNSVVCKLTYGKTSFLFTGDMEEAGRERLYRARADLRADVLKVAHHGSHNGTDTEFLKRVRPSIAVISCGKGNSYRHPHKEALAALQRFSIPVYRTDRQGTIVVISDGSRIRVEGARAALPAQPVADLQRAPSSDQVIGNARTHIYHAPNCQGLPSPRNRIAFSSAQEAQKAGYRPHGCVK